MWPEEPEEGTDVAEPGTPGVARVRVWLGRAWQAPCNGRLPRCPRRTPREFIDAEQ